MQKENYKLRISPTDHVYLKTTAAMLGMTIGDFVVNMLKTLHPLPKSGGWCGLDGHPTSEEAVRKIQEAAK